jgi:hypothetical protein
MNRTEGSVLFRIATALVVASALGRTQAPAPVPVRPAEPDAIAAIVASVRTAERALESVELAIETSGRFGSGDEFTTRGTLHVLRTGQPRLRAEVEFQAVGLKGRCISVRTPDGVTLHQDDPASGELLVRIPKAVVADLEWAGGVLDRSDLPGMTDARAQAPLGSAVLAELARQFALQVGERKERGGEAGRWLQGERRPGLPEAEAVVPEATRAVAFVRDRDQAVLEVVYHQQDKVLQRIDVKRCVVNGKIADAVFVLEPPGLKVRELAAVPSLQEPIERTLQQAERKASEKAAGPVLRPSRR